MAYVGPVLCVLFILALIVWVCLPEDEDVAQCRDRRDEEEVK